MVTLCPGGTTVVSESSEGEAGADFAPTLLEERENRPFRKLIVPLRVSCFAESSAIGCSSASLCDLTSTTTLNHKMFRCQRQVTRPIGDTLPPWEPALGFASKLAMRFAGISRCQSGTGTR